MIGNPTDLPGMRPASGLPPASVDDVAILAEIAQGDLGRFDVLVNRYKVRLKNYVSHRVADWHHVEDLAQEAFLRLFRAARNGGYSGQASVCTWLFTFADNFTTDYLRALARQRLTLESDAGEGNGDGSSSILDRCCASDVDPFQVAARRESQDRADSLLGGLPEEQRRVVALKVLGGLTLAEIAAVVGCPVGTVASRLLYGLRKIEASLARSGRQSHEE
jgi:RNA polymerase sigma-70 factor (ECF subfamily)